MRKILISVLIVITFCLSLVNPLNAEVSGTDKLKDAVVMYVGSPTSKVMSRSVQIDALNMKVRPVNKDSLTYIPARFVTESFGGRSDWDQKNNMAVFTLSGNVVKLTPFSDIMVVNGRKVKLSAPVEAEYGRILAPMNAFVEAIGKQVFYDKGLIVLSSTENLFSKTKDAALLKTLTADISKPPVVGSQAGLKNLLRQIKESNGGRYNRLSNMDEALSMKSSEAAAPQTQNSTAQVASDKALTGSSDYSATNVQVQGVDEADVVKTDGEYIYQVNGRKIVIAKAYPAKEMALASVISFKDSRFSPQEIYIEGKYLTVIGRSYADVPIYKTDGTKNSLTYPEISLNTAKAIIYDVSNKKDVKVVREVELDGNYISSRKIGTRLYLLANKNIGEIIYSPYWEQAYLKGDYKALLSEGYIKEAIDSAFTLTEKPLYRDTSSSKDFTGIPYNRLHYFPDSIEPNYMVIATLDMAKPGEKADISAYLGAGQNIYSSTQNMYISFTDYESYRIFRGTSKIMPESSYNTVVYKFSLENGIAAYHSKGTVPGSILNQFSMDENEGYFRIATTKGATWRNDESTSKNNVYILDETMNITGKVENMAPGERIYSVRFVGDRGYVVTFRTVDPLFVLDLKNTSSPRILGSLKIPGYSEYLHPYDENHIIGFGKDTVEIKGQAYYLGMKMAMFDVTDVTNPVRKFAVNIGDRGTDSELLRNHKSLLFSKSKNLIAFPVSLYEVAKGDSAPSREVNVLEYGTFTYQGAYVYQVNTNTGFKLKGRITHLTDDDYLKAGDRGFNSGRNIDRILYIDDTLYTLSQEEIRANALSDLKKTGSLMIDKLK